MNGFFLASLLILSVIIPFFLYRVCKGPTVFDRLIGLNGIATKAVLFLLLIGAFQQNIDFLLDIALGYGLLNLVGSLAAGKYLEKKGMIE